nr:EOG090X0ADZ [Artemia franciscana]
MDLRTCNLRALRQIFSGLVLLLCNNVSLELSDISDKQFKGSRTGRLYLTSHRMIFLNSDSKDALKSMSIPFVTMKGVDLEQPVFGANYLKGKVKAQPNGNFEGEGKFKLFFKHGGAIELGQAMLAAVTMEKENGFVLLLRVYKISKLKKYAPPPYGFFDAPAPAYTPPQGAYYGWSAPAAFVASGPGCKSLYMTSAPPPYPGIGGYTQPTAADLKAAEAAGWVKGGQMQASTETAGAFQGVQPSAPAYQNGPPDYAPPPYPKSAAVVQKAL